MLAGPFGDFGGGVPVLELVATDRLHGDYHCAPVSYPDVHRPIKSPDALPLRPVLNAALQLAEESPHPEHVL